MRTRILVFGFILAAPGAAAAPGVVAPPRLLGLSVSNGGHAFYGDTRQLTTVSPNGDGFRDRALIRFRLDRAARVELQVVATDEFRRPPALVWRTSVSLAAGFHTMTWTPARTLPSRTYLLRFVVVGRRGGSRVYGFERPRARHPTSGLVVRIQGVDAAFLQRSYARGTRAAEVSIATDAPSVRLQFFSYASSATGARDLKTNTVAMTPAVKLNWRPHRNAPHVVSLGTSGSWPSGLYFLRITAPDGRVGYAPLILRPRHLGQHHIAVVLSTNTWQAYNFRDGNGDGWGDSWYVSGATKRVDLRRPYLDSGLPYRFREWDVDFLSWLNRTHKDVDFFSDDDFAGISSRADLRQAYGLIVFPEHEEYVTRHEYDVIQRFRDLGGRLIFLSANNFFWQVRRSGPFLRRIALWRKLGRPEAALVGVQYAASNYGGGVENPFVVQGAGAEPWVFAGTGLTNGSTFGRYGVEIDARAASSPPGTVLLARIPHAIGGHDAEMTLYRTPEGSKVFAAGALDFAASLDQPSLSRLLENLWARFSS